MTTSIILCIAWFVAIWWTLVNVSRLLMNNRISTSNFIIQALPITVLVTYYLNIWH